MNGVLLPRLAAATLLLGPAVFGGTVTVGTFNGANLTYDTVEADDGQPTIVIDWGTPILTGNQLDFDPSGYTAAGTNGTSQNVVAPLTYTLLAVPGVAIGTVSVFQAGVYSLAGTGAAGTSVMGAGEITATVTEVDGAVIAPFVLTPVNASFGDSLPVGVTDGPWSLGMTINVETQLTFNAIPFTLGATRIEVTFTPALNAKSEQGNSSSLTLNDLKLNSNTVGEPLGIPEPATFGLCWAGLALAAGAARKWRR